MNLILALASWLLLTGRDDPFPDVNCKELEAPRFDSMKTKKFLIDITCTIIHNTIHASVLGHAPDIHVTASNRSLSSIVNKTSHVTWPPSAQSFLLACLLVCLLAGPPPPILLYFLGSFRLISL